MNIHEILEAVKNGKLSVEEAEAIMKSGEPENPSGE